MVNFRPIPETASEMGLDGRALTKAVWAYDAARCRAHGNKTAPMSEANACSIAPMIAAALMAYQEELSKPVSLCRRCGCLETDPIHLHGCGRRAGA